MKSKVEGEKGNPTHRQCAVSLCQSLKLLTEILPMGERASSQKREGRCGGPTQGSHRRLPGGEDRVQKGILT